jgi:hypothetical protein
LQWRLGRKYPPCKKSVGEIIPSWVGAGRGGGRRPSPEEMTTPGVSGALELGGAWRTGIIRRSGNRSESCVGSPWRAADSRPRLLRGPRMVSDSTAAVVSSTAVSVSQHKPGSARASQHISTKGVGTVRLQEDHFGWAASSDILHRLCRTRAVPQRHILK